MSFWIRNLNEITKFIQCETSSSTNLYITTKLGDDALEYKWSSNFSLIWAFKLQWFWKNNELWGIWCFWQDLQRNLTSHHVCWKGLHFLGHWLRSTLIDQLNYSFLFATYDGRSIFFSRSGVFGYGATWTDFFPIYKKKFVYFLFTNVHLYWCESVT